jgi:iron complex outermembrane receptor protein
MAAQGMVRFGRNGMVGVVLLFAMLPANAAAATERAEDRVQLAYLGSELPELTLPELMDLEVTSATGKEQKLSETAAAIFVITREDIRRSGVTSIPEVLRMVPGLTVARIDANKWAISSRSFNSRYANKLLVLMDGRSVFNTIFPSTFWDVQDTLLEDIDRIEVIRGPGATLWGANAVNGVINIITRDARLTQGALVTAGGGSEERLFGGLRYGGQLGPEAFWRGYAKYFQRDDSHGIAGQDAADDWDAIRGGFRLDWLPKAGESLTVQGDAYTGSAGVTGTRFDPSSALPRVVEDEAQIAGANLLSRWEHVAPQGEKTSLQLYYDWSRRQDFSFDEDRHAVDLSLQNRLKLGRRHEFVWGGGYNYTLSEFESTPTVSLRSRRTEHLYNLFIQDEITLFPDRLILTVGARLEHNSYTDYEFQPNVRLLGMPGEYHSLWGAMSRVARTPSRFDREIRVLSPFSAGEPPAVVILSGSRDFDAEEVTAFELGYRYHPDVPLGFDAALFYNIYDRLRSFELGAPFPETSPPPLHTVQPATLDNRLEGEAYGLELAAEWQALKQLKLSAAYTWLQISIRHRDRGNDPFARIEEEKSPSHQGSLRAGIELPAHLELDLWLRYVDRLRRDDIPSYLELDTRLGWKPRPNLEVALVGQNLLDSHHPEFPRETLFNVLPTEVQRGVYVKLTWRN